MTLPDNTPKGKVEGGDKGQDPPATPTPEPITQTHLDDALKKQEDSLRQEFKEMSSKVFSGAQSHTDNVAKNLRKEVKSTLVDKLNQLGYKVTPEALAVAERELMLDDMVAERTAPSPGVNEPVGPGEPPAGDAPQEGFAQYVTQLGDQLCEKLEVEFTDKDPEWAEIEKAATTGNALTFLDAIREQAAKKKDREASSRDARLPVAPDKGGPANPLDGLTRDELWGKVEGG